MAKFTLNGGLLILAIAVAGIRGETFDHTRCYSTSRGTEYAGTIAETRDGVECQRWDTENDPHDVTDYSVGKFPDATKSDAENYCRNPSNARGGPWCYTKDPDVRKQFCDVPLCFGWVDGVEPRHIAVGGEVRMTIRGRGFATNQFNFGDDSHVGNRVWFVNDYRSIECSIFSDGSNEEMIQCYTPNEVLEDSQWKVRLSIDGVETPTDTGICNGSPHSWSCSFRAYPWYSPYITSIVPASGPVDGIITMYGKFFTDLYGSNLAAATNGNTAKVLRAYVMGKPCELKDGDLFYGMALDSEGSNNGYIKCKISGLGAAFSSNVSVIIEAPYGRTYAKPSSQYISATGKIFMYQSYAVIDSISSSSGSIAGGQLLTISGKGFDETRAPADVKVGEEDCVVESVTVTEILCRTPAKPAETMTSYPGNRGMWNDYFNTSVVNLAEFDDLLSRTDMATTFWSDGIYWCEGSDCHVTSGSNNFNVRSRGFFIPRQTGDYRFYIKADDYAVLNMDIYKNGTMIEIAQCPGYTSSYFTRAEQESTRFTFQAGEVYEINVLSREGSGGSYAYVAAKLYETDLVERIAGKVEPEVQDIQISSTVSTEQLKITLNSLSTRSETQEVQTVEMTYSDPDGIWQLGLNGVYTEMLNVDASAIDVQNALNELPSIYPERVSVTASDVTNGRTYTVTFDSELGDWPKLTRRASGGASVTVSESTDGKASLSKWRLHLEESGEDLISDIITTLAPSAELMKENIESLFSARCPRSIGTSAYGKKAYESFEDDTLSGTIDRESEPYCGRASVKNPWRIYDGQRLSLTGGGFVCFAYRGNLRNIIKIRINSAEGTGNYYPEYVFSESDDGLEWFYTCIDVLALAEGWWPNSAPYSLDEFELYREVFDDFWVDEFVIAGRATTEYPDEVNDRRIHLPVRVSNVEVSHNDTSMTYDVEIIPYDCANSFKMIRVYLAPRLAGSSSTGSTSVTWGDSTGDVWPSGASIKIDRTTKASPPVTGTWDLISDTVTKSFDADTLATTIEDALALDFYLSDIKVEKSATCYGYLYKLEYTQTSGDLPALSVNGSNLVGDTPDISLTERDGHVFYDPIGGDMVVTSETMAQVRVTINNINSKCEGSCSYEWRDADTPSISGVTPTSGANGEVLTITGSGFSTTASENSVMVGQAPCVVTAATATEITCTLGVGVLGDFSVKVTVSALGLADGTVEFTYNDGTVDAFSPISGSIAGGTFLTITGSGFDDSSAVFVNDAACVITVQSPAELVCRTPAGSTDAASVEVNVVDDSVTLSSSNTYMYAPDRTPNVTSVSLSTVSVAGGENLVIDGEGFGDFENLKVYLSTSSSLMIELAVNETEMTDSSISVMLPALAPDDYTLIVYVSGFGFADFDGASPTISALLRVDAISATQGSFEGGTRMVVVGEGFGTDKDQVMVKVGESECDITDITNENITCYTGRGSKTITITNGGVDPVFGLGYAWKPQVANIMEGDIIRFVWTSPPFVTSNNFKVQQVFSQTADYNGTGFDSGDGTPNGAFEYQFNEPGTYHYTTGSVGTNRDVELRGKVVVSAKEAFAANVTVEVGGMMAIADDNSGVTITETLDCDGNTAQITGCSETDPTSGYIFEFSYMKCFTPSLTEQNIIEGYIDAEITLTGNGFSGTACDNEVMIGEYTCVPSSQSATEIVCAMDVAEKPDIGTSFPVTVRVNNRGNVLHTSENRTFALLPQVTDITPNIGSLNGGTYLTITGSGFFGDPEVQVGLSSCDVISNNYTEIVCMTPASNAQNVTVIVSVSNSQGTQLPAPCKEGERCFFAFDASATPTVDVVDSPSTQLSTPETILVVNGTGLGSDAADLNVMVGSYACEVTDVSDTQFTCTLGALPAGPHNIVATVAGKGNSLGLTITVLMISDSITPSSGSVWGGQDVTISGNGYDSSTMVSIGGVECEITDMNATMIMCVTGPSAAADDVTVTVQSGQGTVNNNLVFSYTTEMTPDVTVVSPASGAQNEELTISGTGFTTTAGDHTVMIGGAECQVTASSATEITCMTGGHLPGSAGIVVHVAGHGRSEGDVEFTYVLSTTSVSPSDGSFGGGQVAVLQGSGFVSGIMLTLCGSPCEVLEVFPTNITFVTPSMESDYASGNKQCDLNVSLSTSFNVMSDAYTYMVSTTSVISELSPRRGGTQGGTEITITGNMFSGNDDNVVTIDGAQCDITSQTVTEIVCTTNAPGRSIKSNVVVQAASNGDSLMANSTYWYVDVWSSNFTWGGQAPPTEADLVVVPVGQLLLLDVDTPVLKMLLIQGGELLFDEVDLTLRAENILIVGGGKLTVGTEEAPFQHMATIEMHGQLRAKELPIYGAKCLAVREGELNLHGKPLRMTWTRLSHTANAGETQIQLEWGQSDWPVGSTIAIATTGDKHSQAQTETHIISAISANGKIITLNSALEYDHLGVTEQLGGGHTLEMRAEVALLSRNVRVIGTRDVQWSDDIEACPDGFDTGEFATQTCFQGRFGDEIGSDQFGAQIMFHAPVKDSFLAVGKLSYIEVNYAGQAFRLGRYPVHFHLNGDMTGSYVRGLAIHETFNRAVNIHGSHNILVEHTVIYNVMGGAFFLEDGIETGNQYYYNLALFVKASSSLLNDDITPAAFWATNPDNHYEHNAVAGGTHFGWWYRLLEHPEGPSATDTICPRKVPLGTCNNNTVHSNGWFGLWTFQDYYPMVGGACSSTEPEPAVFNRFIVWNCDKGLEFVNGGALQFTNCLLVNNKLAGVEGKKNMLLGSEVPYSDRGPMIRDSVIAAYAPNYPHESGGQRFGVILPWSEGYGVHNTTFINFDKPEETVFGITTIQGTCSVLCGGYNYHLSNLVFINGDENLAQFRWIHDGIFVDRDGSFSGVIGGKVLTWTDTLDPSKCTINPKYSHGAVDGALCDSTTKFARMSFNRVNMASMMYKDVHFINEFGSQKAFFTDKRMTHPDGWMAVLEHGQTYKMVWENVEHIVNISYSAGFYDMQGGGIVITHNISSKPDRVGTISGVLRDVTETSSAQLDYDLNIHGDFYYNENEKEMSYLVSNINSRSKRAVGDEFLTRPMIPQTVRCYWPNCDPPPDPNTLPPITARPDWWVYWSNTTIWPGGVLPTEDSDTTINAGMWVVADVDFPKMRTLTLLGNLEFEFAKNPDTNEYYDFTLEVTYLIIKGGRLVVGWEDEKFLGNVEIILNGDQYTDAYPQTTGSTIGQKVIAVFSGLDLHGKQRSPVQTTLSVTAEEGATTITVNQDIDWMVDEEIAITSTSYDTRETEQLTITAVNGRELTVIPALNFRHLGESMTDSTGKVHRLAAEVMLLTRNIKVRGAYHNDMDRLGFGGRILVGSTVDDEGNALTGWARVSYTQFINMGQLGFADAFDPRFTISYVQTGEVSSIKPSYLKGNSFQLGLSPQIGMFGATGLLVQDNVMYRVVGGGMVVFGTGHNIERNLIAHNLWPGSYEGRRELKNVAYEACFELTNARDILFRDNTCAGSERTGFRVPGQLCGVEDPPTWERNKAHSGMFGVMLWETEEISTQCFVIRGFTAWKNFDFGIFVQTPSDRVEFENNAVIENGVGLWINTFSPGSLSHFRKQKNVVFRGGYASGATEWFDCTKDVKPDTVNYELSSLARSWRIFGHGLVGFSLPNCDSGSNNLPTHPFKGRMSYPTIDCKHMIEDTVFANFKDRECGGKTVNDFAIASNPAGDDINHPMYVEGVTVEDSVNRNSLLFFHRSNVGKVNPSDCVDMDCDGHKKCMIADLDGSYLGAVGTVIDDAAYEWDGAPAYGLGDYRIPTVMLTFPNNTRRDPPPNKGIHRSADCVYVDLWQAYDCPGGKYRMLVVESMDLDTEVRRLSPIGLKSRSGDFIDLINGPQDHGWCSGYTCQKRISTFWMVIAEGETYDLYLTGTNPQHTRFYMLQADVSESVRLAVYYFSPQRLDVFADNVYILPTNGEIDDNGNYKLNPATENPPEFIPELSASSGQNYFDREWQLQYLILKGTSVVDVIIKEVVIVSLTMPPMTIDDFFGAAIIDNLAAFLGVPANKIRIVNVVRETSSRRRRDTSTDNVILDIEIGDAPTSGANISEVNGGSLDRTSLLNLTRQVVDAVQLGTLGDELNITILGIDVQEPLPPPENSTDSAWASLSNGTLSAYIQIPSEMRYTGELMADREQQPFPAQPEFSMYDTNGDLVEVLGSRADPWKIEARLRNSSEPDAVLIGNTQCGFEDGVCAFKNLGISHSGSEYIIDFVMVDPVSAGSKYYNVSSSISVREAELTTGFSQVPDKDSPLMTNEMFTVIVDIRDLSSMMKVEDIVWKGHTWVAMLSIYSPEMSPAVNLSGSLEQVFDPVTGLATFADLSLNVRGRYSLEAMVKSTPEDFVLSGRSSVIEVKPNVTMQSEDYSYKCDLRIMSDYDMYAAGSEDLVELSIYNYLQTIDDSIRYHDFAISRGSIEVEFSASGEAAGLDDFLNTVAVDISEGLPLTLPAGSLTFDTYMKLDDMFFKNLTGATPSSGTTTIGPAPLDSSTAAIIAGAVIGGLTVIVLLVLLILLLVKKKTKTGHSDVYDGNVVGDSSPPPPSVPPAAQSKPATTSPSLA